MRRLFPLLLALGCARPVEGTFLAAEADYHDPGTLEARFEMQVHEDPGATEVLGPHPRVVVSPDGIEVDTFGAWAEAGDDLRAAYEAAGWPWRKRVVAMRDWRIAERKRDKHRIVPLLEALTEIGASLQGDPRVNLVVDERTPNALFADVVATARDAGFSHVGLAVASPAGVRVRVAGIATAMPGRCVQVMAQAHPGGARVETARRPWDQPGGQGCRWVRRDKLTHTLEVARSGGLLPRLPNRCDEVWVGGGPTVPWVQVHELVRLVEQADHQPQLLPAIRDRKGCLGRLTFLH